MDPDRISRRHAVARLAMAAGGLLSGCSLTDPRDRRPLTGGGLTARPGAGGPLPASGVYRLFLDEERDARLYVPPSLPSDEPVPLVVALHGSPSSSEGPIRAYSASAAEFGFVLMAPSSRAITWDAFYGAFGPDVAFIDQALAKTFEMCTVDPNRIGLAGFSDGGTYSLALGLTNGDLFKRLVTFSPGGLVHVVRVGMPPVYVAHGMSDHVLPFAISRDRVVPALVDAGYAVTFREFEGGHILWPDYVREGMRWVSGGDLGLPDT